MATFTISGASELAKNLIAIAQTYAPQAIENAATELGLALEANVKLATPVDFGRLRASWGHWTPDAVKSVGQHSGKLLAALDKGEQPSQSDSFWRAAWKGGSFVVEVGTNVDYAPYVEFGTQKMLGRHMLQTGVQVTSQIVEQVLYVHIYQALGMA